MGVGLTKSQCDKLFVQSSTKVQQWPICALNHPHPLLWLSRWPELERHRIPTHIVLDTITQEWEKGTAHPYYSTRKQTWQPSHPYSSKSCWSVPIRCCAPSSIPSTGDNHQAGMSLHVHLNHVKSWNYHPNWSAVSMTSSILNPLYQS